MSPDSTFSDMKTYFSRIAEYLSPVYTPVVPKLIGPWEIGMKF